MNDACSKTRNKQFPNPTDASVRRLKAVANTFIELQQHRHTADYDNSRKRTRTEVLAQIESVQAAFDSWDVIADEQIAGDFLLQLLIQR